MKETSDVPRATDRQPFPDEAVDLIVSHMRVIAEPYRIRLLEELNLHGPGTVQALSDRIPDTTYQNISKHLNILFGAGFVSRQHVGPSVEYSLCDWSGWWLVEQIAQAVTNRLADLSGRFGAAAGS